MSSGPALVLFSLSLFAFGALPQSGFDWLGAFAPWVLATGSLLIVVNRFRRRDKRPRHQSFRLTR